MEQDPSLNIKQCSVCQENVREGELYSLRACGDHHFCSDCWLSNFKKNPNIIWRCMHPNCAKFFLEEDFKHLQMSKDVQLSEAWAKKSKGLKRTRASCPRAGCKGRIPIDVQKDSACPDCNTSICRFCKGEKLKSGECINPTVIMSHPLDFMSGETDSNCARKCRGCGVPFHHQGGCDTIKCPCCGFNTCWTCGSPNWPGHWVMHVHKEVRIQAKDFLPSVRYISSQDHALEFYCQRILSLSRLCIGIMHDGWKDMKAGDVKTVLDNVLFPDSWYHYMDEKWLDVIAMNHSGKILSGVLQTLIYMTKDMICTWSKEFNYSPTERYLRAEGLITQFTQDPHTSEIVTYAEIGLHRITASMKVLSQVSRQRERKQPSPQNSPKKGESETTAISITTKPHTGIDPSHMLEFIARPYQVISPASPEKTKGKRKREEPVLSTSDQLNSRLNLRFMVTMTGNPEGLLVSPKRLRQDSDNNSENMICTTESALVDYTQSLVKMGIMQYMQSERLHK